MIYYGKCGVKHETNNFDTGGKWSLQSNFYQLQLLLLVGKIWASVFADDVTLFYVTFTYSTLLVFITVVVTTSSTTCAIKYLIGVLVVFLTIFICISQITCHLKSPFNQGLWPPHNAHEPMTLWLHWLFRVIVLLKWPWYLWLLLQSTFALHRNDGCDVEIDAEMVEECVATTATKYIMVVTLSDEWLS